MGALNAGWLYAAIWILALGGCRSREPERSARTPQRDAAVPRRVPAPRRAFPPRRRPTPTPAALRRTGQPCTDQALGALISGLTQPEKVRRLDLSNARISDSGLTHLARLKQPTHLNLEATSVRDAGLAHLAYLTNLQSLSIRSTYVRDAGLKHLTGLIQLRQLNLRYTYVGDAGLKHLAGLVEDHKADPAPGVARRPQKAQASGPGLDRAHEEPAAPGAGYEAPP